MYNYLIFAFIVIMTLLNGCSSTIDAVHTDSFNSGCAVINANAKLGYFNQEGSAYACKLICSKELPDGFKYEYNNGMCKVTIGESK